MGEFGIHLGNDAMCCRYTIEKKVFIIILMSWQVIFWTLQLLMTLGWLRD